MYKFVKVKNQFDNNYCWYFKPDSIEQIIEHFKTFVGFEIKRGFHDRMTKHHAITPWRIAIDVANAVHNEYLGKNESWIETAANLENQTLIDRIKFFQEGRDMYFAEGISYMIPHQNSDIAKRITETVESDKLKYPNNKFTMRNVRYISWPGGRHIYAKIGNIDVYDKHGNQKWSTKDAAKNAAKWFITYEIKRFQT